MQLGVKDHTRETFLESLDPNRVQVLEVHCPYCMVGTAPVTITGPQIVTVGTQQTIDMRPKKCDNCRRDFRIGYRQEFVGIQIRSLSAYRWRNEDVSRNADGRD
jgi:hypothetical protein